MEPGLLSMHGAYSSLQGWANYNGMDHKICGNFENK